MQRVVGYMRLRATRCEISYHARYKTAIYRALGKSTYVEDKRMFVLSLRVRVNVSCIAVGTQVKLACTPTYTFAACALHIEEDTVKRGGEGYIYIYILCVCIFSSTGFTRYRFHVRRQSYRSWQLISP